MDLKKVLETQIFHSYVSGSVVSLSLPCVLGGRMGSQYYLPEL